MFCLLCECIQSLFKRTRKETEMVEVDGGEWCVVDL